MTSRRQPARERKPAWGPADTAREIALGFIRIHVLHHASEGPVYGIWLLEELARHGYRMSPGTLYPILHNLASRGLLRRSERLLNGKIRKYYAITAGGRNTLAQMRRKLSELAGEVLVGRGAGLRSRKAQGQPG